MSLGNLVAILLGTGSAAAVFAVIWLTADGLWALWRSAGAERAQRRAREPIWLEVSTRQDFTPELFSVELRGRRKLPRYRPGQYLTLVIDQEPGRTVRRAYSIAHWQPHPRSYLLGIKREADGLGSAWLHANLRPGTRIRALPPRGDFVLDTEALAGCELALVGAGVGITPMRAMLHAVTAGPAKQPRRAVLFHAARTADALLYRDEFRAYAARFPWFRYVPVVSRPDASWPGETGRLTAPLIAARLEDPGTAHCYLCASKEMMQSLMQGLADLGFSPERLHYESFGLRGRIDAAASYRIELEPDRSFAYEGQPSLLHAFEEQGIDIGADCGAGHCGACRLLVASGRVRWLLAAPTGLAAGEILACCCVPDTDLRLSVPMLA